MKKILALLLGALLPAALLAIPVNVQKDGGALTQSFTVPSGVTISATGTGAIHATSVNSGTAASLTALSIRSTGAAFDLTFASSEVLTAGRTLTLNVGDAARSVTLGGNLTLAGSLTTSGAFGSTFVMTGTTSVTFPTSGTLATTAGTVSSITGTAGQITASASTGAVTLSIPSAVTGINSVTSATGSTLTLASLDSNANVKLVPHGTGVVQLYAAGPTIGWVSGSEWTFASAAGEDVAFRYGTGGNETKFLPAVGAAGSSIISARGWNSSSSSPTRISLFNSRGTQAAAVVTSSGDVVGQITMGGNKAATTANFNNSTIIKSYATETYSATAAGTSLVFATTANTTTTAVNWLMLDQDGKLYLGTNMAAGGTGAYLAGTAGELTIAAQGSSKSLTLKNSTGATAGNVIVDLNGGTLPTSVFAGVQLVGPNATSVAYMVDNIGGSRGFIGRRANGTAGSLTAVASGDTITSYLAGGYGATGYLGNRVGLSFIATETWTDSTSGSKMTITGTATGTNAAFTFIESDGSLRIMFGSGGTKTVAAWGTFGIVSSFNANNAGTGLTTTDSSSSGTVATAVADSFAVPTFAASSATTYTNAATVYIAGDVAAGTNVTLTSTYGLWNVGKTRLDGSITFNGSANWIGTRASFDTTAESVGDLGNVGTMLNLRSRSITNTTSSGTVAVNTVFSIGIPTLLATSSTTYTDATAWYSDGAPTASTNVTITRKHSILVQDGTSAASTITGALVISSAIGTTTNSTGIGGGNINTSGDVSVGGVAYFGATTPGSITGSSGAVTMTSGGTNQNVTITTVGTGNAILNVSGSTGFRVNGTNFAAELTNGLNAAPSTDANVVRLFRTGGSGGAYPYNAAGHFVFQSRDTTNRDLVMAGANGVIASFTGAGNLVVGSTGSETGLTGAGGISVTSTTEASAGNGSFIAAGGGYFAKKIITASTITTLGGATFHTTSSALTDGAGASVATFTNAPSAGNPTKWIGINDNGTTRYIPAF